MDGEGLWSSLSSGIYSNRPNQGKVLSWIRLCDWSRDCWLPVSELTTTDYPSSHTQLDLRQREEVQSNNNQASLDYGCSYNLWLAPGLDSTWEYREALIRLRTSTGPNGLVSFSLYIFLVRVLCCFVQISHLWIICFSDGLTP